MGWVTPLGHDIDGVWRRLLAGESGVALNPLFDASTYPTQFCAAVRDFDLRRFLGHAAERHAGCSRNTGFALAAAQQAWAASGLAAAPPADGYRVGVYLGGGEGPINFDPFAAAAVGACGPAAGLEPGALDTVRWAQIAMKGLEPRHELEQDPNLAAGHIAVQFGAGGPNCNTLTACAASTQAIGEASNIIMYGDADVMISGGAHSMIHPLGVTGFNRLTALSTRNDSPQTASRPFDQTRDGFVIGEGAGMLVLEELEHAKRRGAPILAEVCGFGSTADAFRITDIHEEGRGAIAAMRRAMDKAGISTKDVHYISAHGTGTQENDKIETLAIRAVFAEHAGSVPVSSVKSMIGHLIAAAGAVELITCVLAIRDGMLPPTINYVHPDVNCDLDYVPNHARPATVRTALSNSFGFGGQNDTLVVRAFEG
jgi:3-oxoacyl-[acyl-carrier-protein] synthase II